MGSLGKPGDPCCLTLSIHLHKCQGGPPRFDLSSRPERSVAEGSAVLRCWRNGTRRRLAHADSLVPESETADPSATLRSGRDDKLKAGRPPWHGWRWMDKVKQEGPRDAAGFPVQLGGIKASPGLLVRRAGFQTRKNASVYKSSSSGALIVYAERPRRCQRSKWRRNHTALRYHWHGCH